MSRFLTVLLVMMSAMAAPTPVVVTEGFEQVGDFTGMPEISGMAFSIVHNNRVYLHNDSGDDARFFVAAVGGAIGAVLIEGQTNIDFEDMALGPCGAESCLYIGDVGDNSYNRSSVKLIVVRESSVFSDTVRAVKTLNLRYSDGRAHNVEALGVQPLTGDVFLVSKVSNDPHIYKLTAQEVAEASDGANLIAKDIGTIDLGALFPGANEEVTGMAVWKDSFVLLTYTDAYEFDFDLSQWRTAWTSQLLEVDRVQYKLPRLKQQEAIAYAPSGSLYYTTETGSSSPAPVVKIPNVVAEPPQVGKLVLVSPPTVIGQYFAGQTLSATTGEWSGAQPIEHKFQWKRCNLLGRNCLNILGARADTYILADADVQRQVRVRVTAKNSEGSTWTATKPELVSEGVATTFPPGTVCNASGATLTRPERLKHVVVIFFENKDASELNSAPYWSSIKAQCGSSVRFMDNTFSSDLPSLPHYLAWASGSNCNTGLGTSGSGCITDNSGPSSHRLNTRSIFNQIETRTYNEGMTRNCNRSDEGGYRVKHNPEPYFTATGQCGERNIGFPSIRCSSTPNATCGSPNNALTTDLANDTLAPLSIVVPDNLNSMHDASVAVGDNWLHTYLPSILNSPAYLRGEMAVYVLFDEDGGGSQGAMPNLFISPYITPTSSTVVVNLFAALKAIENQLGVTEKLGCASGVKPGGGSCPEGSTIDLRVLFNF